ncbi:MAG: glucose 1-dehydrogenase [Pseudomonadota bacterium]|nr:glucose 1-dehydrogenase [Pseudomonadota bacterium]
MKLKNKIAIVTGGSSGIGEAISCAYAREGATVIIVNANNPTRGIEVADKIKADGGSAHAIKCDITQAAEVNGLVKQVIQEHGRIDILVNNAAILIFKSLEEHTLNDWDHVINNNLKGAFLMSQAVVPHMKKQHSGKIIFTSSLAAIRGISGTVAYSASKGGILAMARSLVDELGSHNINVNLITPGFTATPMNQELRDNHPDFLQTVKGAPSGCLLMQPQDLTGAAVFLASDDSMRVHGLDLIVDGGAAAVQ